MERPATLTLYGVVLAFEVNAQQPVSMPRALGVNVNVRVVLAPAASVNAAVLDIVNSVLVPVQRAMPVTLSVALPGFEIVTVTSTCEPDPTFPKSTVDGDAEICAPVVAATAAPVIGTLYGLGLAFEVNATHEAVAIVPVAVGAYVTVTVPVAPAATESVDGETVMPADVPVQRPTFVTLSAAVPELETVTVRVAVVLVVTFPKATGFGVAAMDAVVAAAGVAPDSETTVGLWAVSLELMLKQPVSLVVAVGR